MYQHIHFYIKSGYVWGDGWGGCSREHAHSFNHEIQQIFADAGWEIQQGRMSGSAPSAIKGKSKLYLHPMEASGPLHIDLIPEVESILSGGTTFKYNGKKIFEVLSDMTDDEYQKYLEGRHDGIEREILWRFRTSRKNLFITDKDGKLGQVRKMVRIARLTCYLGRSSSDLEWRYVDKVFASLVEDGRIVSARTKHGVGYRTAVKDVSKTA